MHVINKSEVINKNYKKITLNHIRAIKHFSKYNDSNKVSDYERFLLQYVSIPTARKIIKELIDLSFVRVEVSRQDKRVKNLTVINDSIEEFLI